MICVICRVIDHVGRKMSILHVNGYLHVYVSKFSKTKTKKTTKPVLFFFFSTLPSSQWMYLLLSHRVRLRAYGRLPVTLILLWKPTSSYVFKSGTIARNRGNAVLCGSVEDIQWLLLVSINCNQRTVANDYIDKRHCIDELIGLINWFHNKNDWEQWCIQWHKWACRWILWIAIDLSLPWGLWLVGDCS